MEGFLDTIGEYMEVHSTFKGDISKIPNHIVNHGECVVVMLIPCNYYPPHVMVTCRCACSTRSKTVRVYSLFVC